MLEVAQKVNVLQGKMREITRALMATVSELSMYHANVSRMEEERDEKVRGSILLSPIFCTLTGSLDGLAGFGRSQTQGQPPTH